MSNIAGTIPMIQDVDSSGSFTINVPIQLPDCRFMPTMALAYHSAATGISALGRGWALKGAPIIEHVPATIAQDGFHVIIGYNDKDRFALDGLANPTSWEQWLPDGTVRKFGTTDDSTIHGLGSTFTHVWAISEASDPFTNYITFKYLNDDGAFYMASVSYGGNTALNLKDQQVIAFSYESRNDVTTEYVGGLKIRTQLRLRKIQCSVEKVLKWPYEIGYNYAPLTLVSRIVSLALVDATGTKVEPLKFTWSDGDPKVFDEIKDVATLSSQAKVILVTPMDVDAEGHSDLVVASLSQNPANKNKNELYLNIFLADTAGKLSDKPTSGSGFTGLPAPKQLLPFDINGDGQTDLLHISSSDTEGYSLTILLSDGMGFTKQTTVAFKPTSLDGSFHMGDFKGDGQVELVYVYLTPKGEGGEKQLQFVHFTTDGKQLTAEEAQDGPVSKESFKLDGFKVVVGDLNGDGSDDLFVFASRTDTSQPSCMIYFVESVNGKLQYQATDPLQDAGKAVAYNVDSTILPFRADSDGKTSLIVLSKNGDNLQFQILCSLGNSFMVDQNPTATKVKYGGSIVVAKVISQNTVNLVSLVDDGSGPALHLFRFSSDTFTEVPNVTQPQNIPNGSLVHWADLRGVGRTDCLFNTLGSDFSTVVAVQSGRRARSRDEYNHCLPLATASDAIRTACSTCLRALAYQVRGISDYSTVTVRSLQCAGSQPLDRILTSTNGLGAVTNVSYGPLTDPEVYKSKSRVYKQPTSLMNSSANNSTSILPLASGPTDLQHPEATRSDVIYYPTFVVHSIYTRPRLSSSVFETFNYSYSNAKIDFDGRGWLGFQTITKKGKEAGIAEVTTYSQTFPLIGQVSSLERMDGQASLESMVYSWDYKQISDTKNYRITLNGVKETYFEDGQEAYHVNVTYSYDNFDNIALTSISSSQINSAMLTIISTYQEPTLSGLWVVGNKKTEDIKEGTTFLQQSIQDYVSGTSVRKEMRRWISGEQWSMTKLEFDKAGNRASLTGPFVYDEISTFRQEFTYDPTYSTVSSTKTRTSADKYLVESTSFDLATSLLLEVEKPNGLVTTFTYDILGRRTQVSEGPDKTKLDVMEKASFVMQDSMLVETCEINNGLTGADNTMRKVITQYDSLLRPLSVQKSQPDNPTSFICVDTTYDALGRTSSRSRDYLTGSPPQLFQYSYDKRSRLIQETYPPNKPGGASVTHRLVYSCQSGVPSVSETLSDGTTTTDQSSVRQFAIIPNADTPLAGNFVKLCVAKRTNAVGQIASTVFDALARPTKIVDASGVQLTLSYDGISRQIERKLTTGGESPVKFSHFKLSYANVGANQDLLLNVLTQGKVFTTTDFCRRTIHKVSQEEDIDFFYDMDKLSNGQLSKVSSKSNGQTIEHIYTYNDRGNRSSATVKLDNHTLVTKYAWTIAGQLLKVTNPDDSFVSQTYFPDGITSKKSEITVRDYTVVTDDTVSDKPVVVKASIVFSDLDNAFGVLKTRTFGNGLTSKVSIIDSGVLSGATLTNEGQAVLLDQKWDYDAFNKISSHKVGDNTATYQYDSAGQILKYDATDFEYDTSGNIKTKGDYTFTNDGWQLKSMKNSASTSISYEYTLDGNVKTKIAGEKTTSITYDSEGRLAKLDDATFRYDYAGRLLKTTAGNGDVVIYASPTCEIKVPKDPAEKEATTAYLVGASRWASYTTDWKSGDSTVHYFHHDQLGSTVAVSDSKGSIVTQYSYDALGNMATPQTDKDKDIARYTYCGKELFGTLYYFGSRFYDPEIGRFLTLDNYPIDIDNISPSSFNLYLFSQNDPVNYIDVNGNGPVPWWHWLVDAALIVGGTVVSIVGNPIVGGALLGAGISGLLNDMGAAKDDSSKLGDWLFQLALGGVLGGAGAYAGGWVASKAANAAISSTARGIFQRSVVTRFAAKVTTEFAIGAAGGAIGQIATNLYDGKWSEWYDGVGMSALYGGIFGAILPAGRAYGKALVNRSARHATSLLQTYSYPMSSIRSGSPNLQLRLAQGRSSPTLSGHGALTDGDLGLALFHADL